MSGSGVAIGIVAVITHLRPHSIRLVREAVSIGSCVVVVGAIVLATAVFLIVKAAPLRAGITITGFVLSAFLDLIEIY